MSIDMACARSSVLPSEAQRSGLTGKTVGSKMICPPLLQRSKLAVMACVMFMPSRNFADKNFADRQTKVSPPPAEPKPADRTPAQTAQKGPYFADF
jgi:hypothetical protein